MVTAPGIAEECTATREVANAPGVEVARPLTKKVPAGRNRDPYRRGDDCDRRARQGCTALLTNSEVARLMIVQTVTSRCDNRTWEGQLTPGYAIAGLLAATVLFDAAASGASAATIRTVEMTFASGATFSGTVTFEDDFSKVLDVDGKLFGYQYEDGFGYSGTGYDEINWIRNSGTNYSSAGGSTYHTYLMDGPGDGYTATSEYRWFIGFGYDYSDLTNIVLANVSGVGVAVNHFDRLVMGSIENIAPVPLPAALPLFLAGLAGLGFVGWRKRAAQAQRQH